MKKKILGLALYAAASTGCTVIDKHERVPGWPELKVVEHQVAYTEMRDRCARFTAFPEGCTVFLFDRGEAHIYVSKDRPVAGVLEHERLHAAGYDHIGSKSMQQMLAAWKARRTSAE